VCGHRHIALSWQPADLVVPTSQWKVVRAMRSDDEAYYQEFVGARARALRRTAYLLCGDWHCAEDLVQSVFTSLYVNWHRVRDQSSLDGYVRTMLVRRVIDESRRPWRRETASERLPETAVPEGFAVEDRELVRTALRSLPVRQRAVVVLRFFDDIDVAQTAALLGCSEGTVKSYTARALATLRIKLGQHWPVPADCDGGM
jgi:RNA polymerase sigma-70 factor (sigma-E family)